MYTGYDHLKTLHQFCSSLINVCNSLFKWLPFVLYNLKSVHYWNDALSFSRYPLGLVSMELFAHHCTEEFIIALTDYVVSFSFLYLLTF